MFAPVHDYLGLVIVDEEHDASYKQEEAPRLQRPGRGRGPRASGRGALVVLGSATPSMESYFNALNGKYNRIVLERRVLDRPLAAITVVDMRDEYAASRARCDSQPRAGRGHRQAARAAVSSRSCCSTAAAFRPRCSAGSARAR